jgi:predicted nucleic acid-binding protein
MFYLDTTLLVAAYTLEPATSRALAFLETRSDVFAVSDWVGTEFSAALSIKLRTKAINEAYRAKALALFAKSLGESMEVIPVAAAHFKAAAKFADEHKLGLRAGDALHLAIARGNGATICTLDKRLAAVAKGLGFSARLI